MREEKQFLMLMKEGTGRPYPFTEALFARGDMKKVWMTHAEILEANGGLDRAPEAVVQPEPKEKPDELEKRSPKQMSALAAANLARRQKAEEKKAKEVDPLE